MSRAFARLRYYVSDAADEWRHSPGVNLLAIVTLAAVLSLAGAALLVVHNVGARLDGWRTDVKVRVYLRDDAGDEARKAIASRLSATPGVSAVRLVTKDEALVRFRESFGELSLLNFCTIKFCTCSYLNSGSRHPSEDDTPHSSSPHASGWSVERLTEWICSQVISYI